MKIILVFVLIAVSVGCTQHASRLSRISIGDTQQDIRRTMGEPNAVRGSMINHKNQRIEVWEYTLDTTPLTEFRSLKDYWLYFANGRLYKWGEPGDWGKDPNIIMEHRLRTGDRL
ncbi:MAG: hypothetical protein ACPG4X_14720 [Pikeienuella sp.]